MFNKSLPLTVIYHGGNCRDGFCSAWLVSRVFPDATFIAANYGEAPPDVTGQQLLIVDFSYHRDWLRGLQQQCLGDMVLLDHHETAQAALEGFKEECERHGIGAPHIVFDMQKSGAMLTYEFLNNPEFGFSHDENDRAKWIVHYCQDRDLWRWELPDSRAVNEGIRLLPFNFEQWTKAASRGLTAAAQSGQIILDRNQVIINSHLKHAYELKFHGYDVLCVNCTGDLQSEILQEMAKNRPFSMCYFDTADGDRVYSLRSSPNGIHVGELARQYGGGGHKHAAGFKVKATPKLFDVDCELNRLIATLRSATADTALPLLFEAANKLQDMSKLTQQLADFAICEIEGAAHSIREMVGYVSGPYPDLDVEGQKP
jgi:uncharacterized protein